MHAPPCEERFGSISVWVERRVQAAIGVRARRRGAPRLVWPSRRAISPPCRGVAALFKTQVLGKSIACVCVCEKEVQTGARQSFLRQPLLRPVAPPPQGGLDGREWGGGRECLWRARLPLVEGAGAVHGRREKGKGVLYVCVCACARAQKVPKFKRLSQGGGREGRFGVVERGGVG